MEQLKKILPHFLSFIGFIGILSIYFSSAFFDGKELPRNDISQSYNAAKETVDFRGETGEEPLWTGRMFSGMPTYLLNTKYSGDIVHEIQMKLRFLPGSIDTFSFHFIGFYVLCLVLGLRPLTSFVSSVVFMFSSFTILSIEAGHVWKIIAMGCVPLVLAGMLLIFKKKYFLGSAIFVLATALIINSNHYQVVYYFIFFAFIGVLATGYDFVIKKDFKHLIVSLGLFGSLGLVSIGPSIGGVWSIMEYNPFSMRGGTELVSELTSEEEVKESSSGLTKDYAFAWSQGKWETFTLLIPNLYGGSSHESLDDESHSYKVLIDNRQPKKIARNYVKALPTYWGDQPFTGGPMYAGVVLVFFFVFAIITMDHKHWSWIVAGGLFLLFISWGRNLEFFNYAMFDYFPMFNKFRTVSMAIFFPMLALVIVGAMGFEKVLTIDSDLLKKNALRSLYITAGSIMGVYLLTFMFEDFVGLKDAQMGLPDWLMAAIVDDRKSMLNQDTFRSIFIIISSFVLVYLFSIKKLNKMTFIILIGVLSIGDLVSFNKRYLKNADFTESEGYVAPRLTKADQMILKDKGLSYRVLNVNNPFNEATTSYFHKSIGGYSGLKMRRYQDIIERQISKNNQAALDMLNTKYLILKDPNNPVYQRRTACGNAWFVTNVVEVNSPIEEINALNNDSLNTFNPNVTAVVDVTNFKTSATKYSEGEITLTDYIPNKMSYTSSNSGKGLAVFSEVYYPIGWNAYIDGKKSEYIRVNYILRGLELPKGEHEVVFKFEPVSYTAGNQIALYSSILVLLIFGGGLFLGFKKEFETEVKEE